jgi:hypothetical protein
MLMNSNRNQFLCVKSMLYQDKLGTWLLQMIVHMGRHDVPVFIT